MTSKHNTTLSLLHGMEEEVPAPVSGSMEFAVQSQLSVGYALLRLGREARRRGGVLSSPSLLRMLWDDVVGRECDAREEIKDVWRREFEKLQAEESADEERKEETRIRERCVCSLLGEVEMDRSIVAKIEVGREESMQSEVMRGVLEDAFAIVDEEKRRSQNSSPGQSQNFGQSQNSSLSQNPSQSLSQNLSQDLSQDLSQNLGNGLSQSLSQSQGQNGGRIAFVVSPASRRFIVALDSFVPEESGISSQLFCSYLRDDVISVFETPYRTLTQVEVDSVHALFGVRVGHW